MTSKPTFYITTTLPYVNGEPHIGFALEIIEADVAARFHALKGENVVFNTGTDEHGMKLYKNAQEKGMETQAYVDEYAAKFHLLKDALNLSYTNFIRTTDAKHKAAAQEFWLRCLNNGDIYKKQYQINYCVGCELEKTESELVDGKCPIHPTYTIEHIDEENYFFRWSKYQQPLLDLYAKDPNFVQPAFRMKEITNFVAGGLQDFSISRLKAKMPWGVQVPNDPDHVMYVWFDALVNYISTLGWPTDEVNFNKCWPGVQLCGKDNLRQQSAMWQAMLMSAKLPISKRIYVNGFITVNGQKMSKSIGNVINPITLSQEYGTDLVRYFLLREIPFGDDGDFSYERLRERNNADLGNTFGNLVNRAIAMSRKYFDGNVPPVDVEKAGQLKGSLWMGRDGLQDLKKMIELQYEGHGFDTALNALWNGIESVGPSSGLIQANKFIEETQPFKLVKVDPEAVANILYSLLEACRWYAWFVNPAMPETSKKIFAQLGLDIEKELAKGWDDALVWGGLTPGAALGEPTPLFPRLVVDTI
ncbi:methionine--tRNA ligase [Patescibacteria group bacterium]|nr:methionine--tRNA ligase [Patescibacteria group bacterium]